MYVKYRVGGSGLSEAEEDALEYLVNRRILKGWHFGKSCLKVIFEDDKVSGIFL